MKKRIQKKTDKESVGSADHLQVLVNKVPVNLQQTYLEDTQEQGIVTNIDDVFIEITTPTAVVKISKRKCVYDSSIVIGNEVLITKNGAAVSIVIVPNMFTQIINHFISDKTLVKLEPETFRNMSVSEGISFLKSTYDVESICQVGPDFFAIFYSK